MEAEELEEKVKRQFDFASIQYYGPSKNYVFKCVEKNGRLLVLKIFFIHPRRREEDLAKAWREIAFNNYAGSQLHLPQVVASAFESDLGVYLLSEFKQMPAITQKQLEHSAVLEKVSNRLKAVHSLKLSSLNPGLRARIFEEDLRNNGWVAEALAESNRFDEKQLKKASKVCSAARENGFLSVQLKTLVHGDSRLQNFYLDADDSVQLRDFEHACINSPLLDWASLYLSVSSPAIREKVKELAFEEAGGSSREREEAFSFMLLHRSASWVKFNVSYARDRKAAAKRLDEAVSFIGGVLS